MTIPENILDRVKEFTPEGFIIFSISSEGSPEVTYTYNSNMASICLQRFAALWAYTNDENQHEMMAQSMNHVCEDDDDEE